MSKTDVGIESQIEAALGLTRGRIKSVEFFTPNTPGKIGVTVIAVPQLSNHEFDRCEQFIRERVAETFTDEVELYEERVSWGARLKNIVSTEQARKQEELESENIPGWVLRACRDDAAE